MIDTIEYRYYNIYYTYKFIGSFEKGNILLRTLKRILAPIVVLITLSIIVFYLFPKGLNSDIFSDSINSISENEERFITYSAFGNNFLDNKILNRVQNNRDGSYKSNDEIQESIKFIYKYMDGLISGNTISSISNNFVVSDININDKTTKMSDSRKVTIDNFLNYGFNTINVGNTEVYSKGLKGVESTYNYYKSKNIDTIGINKDDGKTKKNYFVKEYNKIKVGIISYIQNDEMLDLKSGNYSTNILEKSNLQADIHNLKKESDAIIVNITWADSDDENPTELQKQYARQFSDLGVDVILGYNKKTIQPIDFITNADGEKTLVAYSLGNLSYAGKTLNENLGINLSFQIRMDGDGNIKILDAKVIPLMTHFEKGYKNYQINFPHLTYNDKMAESHFIYSKKNPISVSMIRDKFKKIFDDYIIEY